LEGTERRGKTDAMARITATTGGGGNTSLATCVVCTYVGVRVEKRMGGGVSEAVPSSVRVVWRGDRGATGVSKGLQIKA